MQLLRASAQTKKIQLHNEWQLKRTRWGQPLLWPAQNSHGTPAALDSGTAMGHDHRAWPMEPPAPQAQRQWARQSCRDTASWAVPVCYQKKKKNFFFGRMVEIVLFIVLASETIKFSTLLLKRIFNPVNSRAYNCLKQIATCITVKSLLL